MNEFNIEMKTQLQKDLYKAFFDTAVKYGDEIFKMSCYAKHGVFAEETANAKT